MLYLLFVILLLLVVGGEVLVGGHLMLVLLDQGSKLVVSDMGGLQVGGPLRLAGVEVLVGGHPVLVEGGPLVGDQDVIYGLLDHGWRRR